MKFNLWSYEVEVTDFQIAYAHIYRLYHNLAISHAEKMEYIYDEYGSLHEVIKYAEKTVKKIYSESIDASVRLLQKNKIYSIDSESFAEYCNPYCHNFFDAFGELYEKHMELIGEKNLAEEYRRYRKNARGRLVGGGFGFEGAVKGIATAGAANMATGLLHSMFNALDGAFTNAGINRQMKQIYKDPKVKESLVSGVFKDVSNMVYAFFDAMGEKYEEAAIEFTPEMIKQSRVIYNNIMNGSITDDIEDAIVEMLALAPLFDEYFLAAYQILGDDNNELARYAKTFESDVDISGLKKKDQVAIEVLKEDFDVVEEKLNRNDIYQSLRGHLDKSFEELIELAIDLLNDKLKNAVHCFFHKDADQNKLNNAMSNFAFIGKNERLLLFFDNSTFSNGSSGIVLTNRVIYYKGGSTPYPNIEYINVTWGEIDISGKTIGAHGESSFSRDQLRDLIEFFSVVHKYIATDNSILMTNTNNNVSDSQLEKKPKKIGEMDYFQYIREIFESINDKDFNKYIYPIDNSNEKSIKKFKSAIAAYANLAEGEFPLICFDNTVFGSAKDGCIVTTYGLHIHNSLSKTKYYSFFEINKIELKGFSKSLYINDYEVQTTLLGSNAKTIFCSILNKMLIDFR
jgi:hypothetical protein